MLETKQHRHKCCDYFLFSMSLTRLTLCCLAGLWSRKWSFYTCSGEADIISEQEWNQKWQMQLFKNYGSSKPHFNVSHSNSDYVCLFSILPIADQRTLQRWKHHANVYAENSQYTAVILTTINLLCTAVFPFLYRFSPWVAEHMWALTLNMFPSDNRTPGTQQQWQPTTLPRLLWSFNYW